MAEQSQILSVEVSVEQSIDNTPIAACMGASACKRVCMYIYPENELAPQDPTYAMYGEQTCGVLDDLASQDPAAIREILDVVTIRRPVRLNSEQTAHEAGDYIDYLHASKTSFEDHLSSLLAGTGQPRFIQQQAEATYSNSKKAYESSNVPADLAQDEKNEVMTLHALVRGFSDLATLKEIGILFDANIKNVLELAAKEIGVGHHIKLVGEPGIAKTTLAKYLAYLNARAHRPNDPEENLRPIVLQLSSTSEAESQMSEQTFEENTLGSKLGKIARAMKTGVGIVLDEQNGMTADQQTFFNDYFLKKPGQMVTIDNETFVIQKGFSIIATLNPMTDTQGNRRHGRQQQDSANAARFTRIDLKYPDQEGYVGNGKETISRLFFARYVDNFGWAPPTTRTLALIDDIGEYTRDLTRMATAPPKDASTTSSLTGSQLRPDLAECITPRDLDRILETGLSYGDIASAVSAVRKGIYDKTQQIINSDNGHYVNPKASSAVKVLLAKGRFNA